MAKSVCMLKVLLVGVNARHIHANPALYSLLQSARQEGLDKNLIVKEYALHSPIQYILADIYKENPDILGFSFYVWNAQLISILLSDIKKLLPNIKIILGGPEASSRAFYYLNSLPVDAICIGEGESNFNKFLLEIKKIISNQFLKNLEDTRLPVVPGFLIKGLEKKYQSGSIPDLSKLPFLYDEYNAKNLKTKKKIIYYEASRGCPYHCTFCASACQPLRERPLDLVLADLPKLADLGGQIKFIDRTFNANPERAMIITQTILALRRPKLSWHFEISPYCLTHDLVQLWITAPINYFHLEIGVQSLNKITLTTIDRPGNWDRVEHQVEDLIEAESVSVHLDLIAGLPYETPKSFANSFHRLHQLNPDYLQLGFLKVLPGSLLEKCVEELGLIYSQNPPYQILSTPDMTPEFLFQLHRAERAFNALYNKTKKHRQTLISLANSTGDALRLYMQASTLLPQGGLNPRVLEDIIEQLSMNN